MRTAGLLGTVQLPGRVISVSVARAFVRELLGAEGWRDADDAELLVSELVTNAVRHSASGSKPLGLVTLTVTDNGDALHVDVIDEGAPHHVPRVQEPTIDGDSGRGLWLVEQIASAWGVREDQAGRTVWFEIAVPR
ncbi:ATP-binding protein [Sphaerisporangium sp. NPDC088356]|uniref:ATP-binding protein n=1 Tax=Sphaerisporangium sp. NPDC088356 TaxID=3154871 RepID=UPI0034341CB4